MLIDLHLHSTFSDGLLTVEQLVKKARQKKIKLLALTDHDTLAGVGVFQKLCAQYGIRGVSGVEISTDYEGRDLHLLAYHPKYNLRSLQQHLRLQQKRRRERAKLVVERLKQLGLFFSEKTEEHLLRQENIGKPHLGRAVLREKRNRQILRKLFNFQGSLSDFIGKFLDKPGQVGYVPKSKIKAAEAIRLINKTGAKAVLAHPGFDLETHALAARILKKLKKAGLFGLELPCQVKERKFYSRLAQQLGLLITYGSDSHNGKGMGVKVSQKEYQNLFRLL